VRTYLVVALAILVVIVRLRSRRRRTKHSPWFAWSWGPMKSAVGLVAGREIRERLRSRMFRVGTVIILMVVGAAIVIPVLTKSKPAPERVGVVGVLPSAMKSALATAASVVGSSVRFTSEFDIVAARRALDAGDVDVVIVRGDSLIVTSPLSASDTSTRAQFVSVAATDLGIVRAMARAQLTLNQSELLAGAKPLTIASLHPGRGGGKHAVDPTSLIGDILIFTMLSQYNTWTLIGVMEEKSSRVIEVLLAAVRPLQLLGGKVLGIGATALAQASLIVAFAIVVAKIVGSTLVHGSSPLVVASTLVWLVAGYAFYCWVYAAAGSMAERQDQVQSLAFPLTLPMIFGYIMSLIGASSGSPSTLLKVIAYLPPTAPFAMPVLVGMKAVTWWEFATSLMISLAATVVVARVASEIYRRSILRTGRRMHWRDVMSSRSA